MIQITSEIRRAICLIKRIADHRYSAIGRHLRDAHGNIDLLNESQFRMLKKCRRKWDCLVYEMLYISTIRPNLNTQSNSIRAKLFVYPSIRFNCPRRVLAQRPEPEEALWKPRVIGNMYGITRKNLESQEQGPQRILG